MNDTRVKVVCSVNGEYEIYFWSPFMEKVDAEQFCSNFDDWSDFIAQCFNPKVFVEGTKSVYDVMFFTSITTYPQIKEEM